MTDVVTKQDPVLTAQKMAEFLMQDYNTDEYRRRCLKHFDEILEKDYVDDVRRIMNGIRAKQRKAKRSSS